jgi:hypothetical protein
MKRKAGFLETNTTNMLRSSPLRWKSTWLATVDSLPRKEVAGRMPRTLVIGETLGLTHGAGKEDLLNCILLNFNNSYLQNKKVSQANQEVSFWFSQTQTISFWKSVILILKVRFHISAV